MPSAPANVTPAVLAQTYGVILPYVDRAGKGRQAVAEFQGQLMSKMDLEEFFRHEVPGRKPGDDRVDRFAGAPYREGHGVEALLDVEFMMGVAPGVKTEFWEWPNNDFCADLHNYSRALLKPGGPLVNSISYGWQGDLKQVGCHEEDQKAVDVKWAKLAAAGITVFISSGDSGSACRLNGCDEAHLRRAVEIVGERRGASHNLDLYACCEEAQQEHAPSSAGPAAAIPARGHRRHAQHRCRLHRRSRRLYHLFGGSLRAAASGASIRLSLRHLPCGDYRRPNRLP